MWKAWLVYMTVQKRGLMDEWESRMMTGMAGVVLIVG